MISLGQVISRGAEAVLYIVYVNGVKAVAKIRICKKYRDDNLDKLLRYKRTVTEAKIISYVKELGVPTPSIIFVDPYEGLLIMEYIEGYLLRDLLNNTELKKGCSLMEIVGQYVGIMHSNNVVHGDLTTSNMILKNDKVFLIDFGLSTFSNELEDLGVDIHLMLRALESTHYDIHKDLFKCFLKGYKKVVGEAYTKKILEKVREIRLRGRYVEERRKKI